MVTLHCCLHYISDGSAVNQLPYRNSDLIVICLAICPLAVPSGTFTALISIHKLRICRYLLIGIIELLEPDSVIHKTRPKNGDKVTE